MVKLTDLTFKIQRQWFSNFSIYNSFIDLKQYRGLQRAFALSFIY